MKALKTLQISRVRAASTLSLIGILIFSQSMPANSAVIPINNFLLCASASEMNCIVSLSAEFEDGRVVSAIPTGVVSKWDSRDYEQNIRTYAATEWKIQGLKNSSGTNTVVTQMWMQKPNTIGNQTDFGALDFTIFASLFDSTQDELSPDLCKAMKVIGDCKYPPQFTQKVRFTTVFNSNLLEPGLTTGSVENVTYTSKDIEGGKQFTIAGNAMEIPVNLPVEANTGPGDFTQALANHTYWHLYTIDRRNTSFDWGNGKSCSPDNPIISSNAAYAGFPEFDKQTQEIKLKVSSPHLKADGKTLEVGQFRATISLAGIACLWGINSSAISPQANVNVTYDDGSSSVAVLTSRVVNKTFSIQATGYHYSSPTIRLNLTEPTKSDLSKKITISCVKGKIAKKVSGVNPTCPAGYKKK